MFRVVAFVFSFDSKKGLGNAPSPPPCVTLKTSAPLEKITCAVDLGMVSGSWRGKGDNAVGRKVTRKLVPSLV